MSRAMGLWDKIGLHGFRLIEASAGTGKTYNLVKIYSRMIESEALDAACILVMSFTKAATEDIRKKVRESLFEALDQADLKDSSRLEKLRKAIECLNEAPVSTIHAFALRATAELVLESGGLFNRGNQTDERLLFKEALADFWRDETLGRLRPWVDYLHERFKGPRGLYDKLEPALDKPFASVLDLGEKEVLSLAQKVRSLWHGMAPLAGQRAAAIDSKNILNLGKRLGKRLKEMGGARGLIQRLDALLEEEGIPVGIASWEWLEDFSEGRWEEQLKKDSQNQGLLPPFDEAFLGNLLSLQKLIGSGAFFLKKALAEAKDRVKSFKQERRLFSYADMIQGLHQALRDPGKGKRLAEALAGLWPYMLVDEFQDTDPIQYEILRTIHKERSEGLLLMIGDPKQAIYSFRGGDVFAYLRALGDVRALGQEEPIRLQTNYRSSPSLILALNTLFLDPPKGNHSGIAGMRPSLNPFILEGIEYKEAKAADRNRHSGLVSETLGQKRKAPALYFWKLRPKEDEEDIKAPRAKKLMLEACIETILQLLDGRSNLRIEEIQGAQEGQGAERARRITPSDIAVLVNTNQEASRVQKRLSKRGIPSVCIHEQSVFQTNEAFEVLRLLRAAALPEEERGVRSALLSLLGQKTLKDFAAFEADSKTFEEEIERFKRARERWEAGGVLAMLVPFLQEAMPRVLSLDDGKRKMSNYLQLAELLAEMEGLSFGMEGLIRSLDRAMEEGGGEAARIRLESDEDLVTVSTVHKAKGLEYGIVFLPFAPFIGLGGKKGLSNPPFFYHDDNAKPCLSFENDGKAQRKALQEYRAEGVRLLYVALTRAKYGVYLGYGPINTAQNGALAWILHRSEGVMDTQAWLTNQKDFSFWFRWENIERRLKDLAYVSSGTIASLELPPKSAKDRLQGAFPLLPQKLRSDVPKSLKPWGFFSFSSLLPKAGPRVLAGPGWEDETWGTELPKAPPLDQPSPILPKGQAFGSAFHSLMQKADFSALAQENGLGNPELFALAKNCLMSWGLLRAPLPAMPEGNQPLPPDSQAGLRLIEAFLELGRKTLIQVLPGLGCALKDIAKKDRVLEMEFFFSLNSTKTTKDFLSAAMGEGRLSQEDLSHSQKILRGLMNGFIDVVFRHEGRYYILDYKTNDLGPDKQAYKREGLDSAMAEHAYGLQYAIYLIALHKYLKVHLEGYSPELLGGVYYLFVRGLRGVGEDGVFWVNDIPPSWILELDDLLNQGPLP